MVPEDIADELASLQDDVPPFNEQEALAIIEKSLDGKIEDLFASFSSKPLASASVAQVHTAKLLSGEDVVIKVIRPGIKKIIGQDIALLKSIAALVENNFDQDSLILENENRHDYHES